MVQRAGEHRIGAASRWWDTAVGYQVYLQSFADGDGDGIGDLHGLIERLDHLVDLGVDLVWVTPFYPSPMVDGGYDVADYCGVDPTYGSLATIDRLLAEAHDRGIRVVADLVPNHTSDQHPWFVSARSGRDSEHRHHYLWADPAPGGGPPNNWVSYFGGPAWTLDPASGQYYLHLFLPEQPDLDWADPAVADAFDDILRFWLDRGMDGFRIDVAQALAKDGQLRSNPALGPLDLTAPRWEQWEAFEHRHDVLQPASLDIFRRWRRIVEPYDALLLGETYVRDAPDLGRLLPGDGLHVGFWFGPMHIGWTPDEVRRVIAGPLDEVPDPRSIGWVTSSHDEPRAATRFRETDADADADVGRRRALALSTLLFGLPGLPLLYQGEELGLVDGAVSDERRADPVGADVTQSRDGSRTPMPWEPGPGLGFTTAAASWLPLGGRTAADTAHAQRHDPDSWLSRYRALIALRRSTSELIEADVCWLHGDAEAADDIIAYRRGPVVVAANVGVDRAPLAGVAGSVLFATDGRRGLVDEPLLEPADAIVVRTA